MPNSRRVPVFRLFTERLFGGALGSILSCRKICKWGPLSDTCRLIFVDRTAGAAGRCPGSCPGPSRCPVTQIRAFVGPQRSGEQNARTWHSYACAAHAPFYPPRLAPSFSHSPSRTRRVLFVLLPGFASIPFGYLPPHALPPSVSRPNCGSRRTAQSNRVRMLSC